MKLEYIYQANNKNYILTNGLLLIITIQLLQKSIRNTRQIKFKSLITLIRIEKGIYVSNQIKLFDSFENDGRNCLTT